jgi:hypothetical protein
MKIGRSMFEGAVNSTYLKLHPEQLKDYMDFSIIRQKRRLEFMKKHAPGELKRIPAQKIPDTENLYNSIVHRFQNKNGKVRGSWCRVPFSRRAEEVGMGIVYNTVYTWASSLMHLDFSGLALQSESVFGNNKEADLFCDVAPSEKWLSEALLVGHASTLLILDCYNKVAMLGMDAEIEAANQAFVKAWRKSPP